MGPEESGYSDFMTSRRDEEWGLVVDEDPFSLGMVLAERSKTKRGPRSRPLRKNRVTENFCKTSQNEG